MVLLLLENELEKRENLKEMEWHEYVVATSTIKSNASILRAESKIILKRSKNQRYGVFVPTRAMNEFEIGVIEMCTKKTILRATGRPQKKGGKWFSVWYMLPTTLMNSRKSSTVIKNTSCANGCSFHIIISMGKK